MCEINLELHDEMVKTAENMPKTHLWDYLPVRKGFWKIIPRFVYVYLFNRKYPDD